MMKSLRKWREKLLGQGELDSPIVVWGVVIVAVIVIKAAVLDPFLDWRSEQYTVLGQLESRTGKIIAMQAVEQEWKSRSAEFEQAGEGLNPGLLQGKSAAARQSELQQLMKRLVNKRGLSMNQVVFLDGAERLGSYETTGLRFKLTGEIAAHLMFVHDLATNMVLLNVNSWQFTERKKDSIALVEVKGYFLAVGGK